MTKRIRVALDAMGGDHGVNATMRGAASLSLEGTDIHVLAVGELDAMQRVLDAVPHDPARITLVRSDGCVSMDAKPGAALTALPDCSVLAAARLVHEGGADAMVSAGNTGATVLAAAKVFSRIDGIRRTALASVYPTERRHGPHDDPFALILDVGATLNATADDLVGFAVMGSAYSSVISAITEPRVALLSNGTEANKGTQAIIAAHERLRHGPLRFVGNIEGLDIPRGIVDVVVCDGFLGNVVLKMLEGMGDVLRSVTAEAAARRVQWRIGLSMLQSGLKKIHQLTDWKVYGGAPLLGFDHVVIKAHGRSEAGALRNAVKVAAKTVRHDLVGRIERGVAATRSSEGD